MSNDNKPLAAALPDIESWSKGYKSGYARAVADHAACQPVGEPEIWVSPGQLEELKRRPAGQGSNYLPTRLASEGNFTQPLYAAPPAQVVDLWQLPRVVELLSNVSRTLVDWAADEQREAIGIVKALIDSHSEGGQP